MRTNDPLLPTPRTSDTNGAGHHGTGGPDLRTVVADLAPDTEREPRHQGRLAAPGQAQRGGHQVALDDVAEHVLLPTPVAQPSGNTPEEHLRKKPGRERVTDLAIIAENGLLETGGKLLPTPAAMDGSGGRVSAEMGGTRDSDDDRTQGQVLLPTPTVGNAEGTNERRGGSRGDELLLPGAAKECMTNWGPYEPAIRRWEAMLGRPAPAPTEPNAKGNHRLSPRFTEWMMGVPEGWITGLVTHKGISRNEQLKAAGNGVVPQQAAAALKDMLAAFGPLEEPAASDELPGQLTIYQELRP